MKEEIVKRRYEALFQMVLEINGPEEREQKVTGEQPTAMFDFAGHCGVANIRVFKKGWYPNADPDIDLHSVYCSCDKQYENACKVLTTFIEEMGKENDK